MPDIDLLVVVPDLAPGGMAQHTATLVAAARERLLAVRVLAVSEAAGVWPATLDTDLVQYVGDVGPRGVEALLRSSGTVLVQAAPSTVHLLPLLPLADRSALAVHGSPGTNLMWWGASRAALLRALLADGGELSVVVPASAYAAGVAAELGLSPNAVVSAPNATFPHRGAALERPGAERLLVAMRLAEDKTWVLDAALALARHARLPLQLVGAGPGADALRKRLRDEGVEHCVTESTDVLAHIERADIVVGVGLVALEAAARGRRVAVAHKPTAGLAGVMRVADWHRLREGNFAGLGQPPADVAEVWDQLRSLTPNDLSRLVQMVEREAAPASLLDAVLAAARPARFAADSALVPPLIALATAQEVHLAAYDRWVRGLQAETQAVATVRDDLVASRALAEQEAEQARQAELDRDKALAERQRVEESLSQVRRVLAESEQERSRLAAVADDVYRQLQEVRASTSWRLAAPVRVVGGVTRRVGRLLPYVNTRRLRVAARLAMHGDLAAIRQRLRATEAVASAAAGAPPAPVRPVRRERAQTWPADRPLVTVVVPCFNYGRYLDDAMTSVLRQTLGQRVELVVVDGGSDESATVERVRALVAAPPPRTRVLLRPDGRHLVGDNRNYGIAQAQGRYVCCLDADDLLHPVYLEVAVFLLERYAYDVVSTATRCFGEVTDTFGLLPEPDLQDMLLANNVTTVAVYRRELWERAGGYHDTGLGHEHIHEDWKLWVRMAALGARMTNITGQELFQYRVHSRTSLSNTAGVPDMVSQRRAVASYNGDVVNGAALAASRAAREVEVVVDGALENLEQPVTGPGVLMCLPFLLLGGAERLLSGVVAHLVRQGLRVVVVTTLPAETSFGDTTEWFRDAGADVFHLPRLLEPHRWTDFFHHLLRNKRLEVLWLAGSAHTYALLPELRREHADLRVVDQLFNTVGHTADNRRYASCIDLHLCENPQVEEWLCSAGEPREKVVRIESGIDLDQYQPLTRPPSDVLRVGFSGRLSDEKDPLAFVDLAEAAQHPRLRFLLTGGGPLEQAVRRRAARAQGAVEYLGLVDDIETHLASLDLLVVPSRLDGRPIAVLEALALGVPVLASRVGGLPSLVRDGENGFLVDAGDVRAMRAAVHRLLEEPELLPRLRRGARRFAEEHLDVRRMNASYEEVVRRLLDEQAPSATAGGDHT